MSSRAKLLYCPECKEKVWPIYDKSSGNYSSIPGIRVCHNCMHFMICNSHTDLVWMLSIYYGGRY